MTTQPKVVWTGPDEAGEIRREGVLIATVKPEGVEFASEEMAHRFQTLITKRLKELQGAPPNPPETPVVGIAPQPAATPTTDAVPADPYAGLNEAQRSAMIWLRKQHDLDPWHVAARRGKPVPLDPLRGDKTPEYAFDLLKYEPAEFAHNYAVIGRGTVTRTKVVPDKETGLLKKVKVQEECVIAHRKCAYTEKKVDPATAIRETEDNDNG